MCFEDAQMHPLLERYVIPVAISAILPGLVFYHVQRVRSKPKMSLSDLDIGSMYTLTPIDIDKMDNLATKMDTKPSNVSKTG